MDDSDLALDMALQRLDESSEIEEDSHDNGSVYSGDGVSQLEVYTPSNLPSTGCVARRTSYHNSGSEESTSLSSFCTDSEGPARSAVYYRSGTNRRGLASNSNRRGAVSDSETSRPRKLGRHSGASLSMNVRVPEEEFYYRIKERLLAVSKDRDTMTLKARDLARQKGQTYDEIMAAEWHELPETRKYLLVRSEGDSPEEANSTIEELIGEDNDERPSSPRLTISPSELTPRTAVSDVEVSGRIRPPSQLEDGMRSLHVRSSMSGISRSKRSSHRGSSSVLSGTASDSGVGDTWATSEIPTPSTNDQRLEDYIRNQSILTNTLPTRERDAHAAAIALMSNSPHPDNLSPHISMHVSRQRHQQHYHHHHPPRSGTGHAHGVDHRQQQRVGGGGGNMPHYSSGDDSSSVFTMTSQSSTSDLFIPRKSHQTSMYTDSEEPHSFSGNMRYRRTLTTPKRSHLSKQQQQHHGQQHPSPLTEQHRPRSTQPSQHGDVMLPAPQQQNQHSLGQGGTGGNSTAPAPASNGPVHVIYHLDNIPTPFHAKWTNGVGITLGTFKDQVFARKGEYRFFFESFNPDLDMALLEEFTEEDSCLPVIRGKIVGRVEKAQ